MYLDILMKLILQVISLIGFVPNSVSSKDYSKIIGLV